MSAEEEIFQVLKTNNPFASASAGDPREDRYPDVDGLGDDILEGIRSIIAQKANSGHMPCAVVVLGEPGSGKTHLIGRLIDESATGPVSFSFAYILPFLDPAQCFRYLLREIVVNLQCKTRRDGGNTQLDFLTGRIVNRTVLETAREYRLKTILKYETQLLKNPLFFSGHPFKNARELAERARKMLMSENPSLDEEFVKVILKYSFFPDRRMVAIEWLKGRAVDSADLEKLDVSDRFRKSPEAREQEAREILLSLDIILKQFGRPLVVFFDQLENLRYTDMIGKFQSVLFYLSDMTKAMLPVAFFRGQDWEYDFSEKFDSYTKDRLSSNKFVLKGCNREQARELIRSRLDYALSAMDRPHELFPFYPRHSEEIEDFLSSAVELHPRQVINRANAVLTNILYHRPATMSSPVSPDETLNDALKTRYEEIFADFERYDPDEDRLTLALELYLSNRPDSYSFTVNELNRTPGYVKYVNLEGEMVSGNKAYQTAFIIDVELHHSSVRARLRRGIDHLKKGSDRKAMYIRDIRSPFPAPPRWKATNNLLDEFIAGNGSAWFVNREEAAMLYALSRLRFDVVAGDITTEDGRMITFEQLEHFIAARLSGENTEAFRPVDEYLLKNVIKKRPEIVKTETFHPDGVISSVIEILKDAPAALLQVDVLAKKLSEIREDAISTESLISLLGEKKDVFLILRAKDGVIVKLKMEWYAKQKSHRF